MNREEFGFAVRRRSSLCSTGIACLLALAVQSAANATDRCADIAEAIRSGQADGLAAPGSWQRMVLPVLASHDKSLLRLDSLTTSDVKGVLTRWHATPALLAAAESFGPEFGAGMTTVAWLGDSGAGAIEDTQGTAHCTHMLFFDISGGAAHEVAPPAGYPLDDTAFCSPSAEWIGAVGFVPALIEEDDREDASGANFTIVQWRDHAWTPPCRIEASFSTVLSVFGAYCAQGRDCHALQTVAIDLATRFEARLAGNDTVGPSSVVAANKAELAELPTFGEASLAPFTTFTSETRFALPAVGAQDFAVIGTSSFGWRDLPGYLVAIWHQDGDTLQPLAGFQMLRQRAKTTSVAIASPLVTGARSAR